ncbi:MAG: hypothetical protein DKT66_24075 [Candidatus Melainabacteria bacterium]|nr:MAG: hypothetical protein DKT66_24075 [Candidatus Melainabacteria bacterium]
MTTILETHVDSNSSAAKALQSILEMGFFETSTIHVASTDRSEEGAIYISKGSAIKGAVYRETCEQGRTEKGYSALRRLLNLKQAYFVYKTGGDHSLALESEGLNVDIEDIIQQLPNLPPEAPDRYKQEQTIPPNQKQRFEIDAEELRSGNRPQVDKHDPDKVARGKKRMRRLEMRNMILKGPLIWACVIGLGYGVWHYFGPTIKTALASKGKTTHAVKHKPAKKRSH